MSATSLPLSGNGVAAATGAVGAPSSASSSVAAMTAAAAATNGNARYSNRPIGPSGQPVAYSTPTSPMISMSGSSNHFTVGTSFSGNTPRSAKFAFENAVNE